MLTEKAERKRFILFVVAVWLALCPKPSCIQDEQPDLEQWDQSRSLLLKRNIFASLIKASVTYSSFSFFCICVYVHVNECLCFQTGSLTECGSQWLASELWWSAYFSHFGQVLEIQTQVPKFMPQTFHPLSHICSPSPSVSILCLPSM